MGIITKSFPCALAVAMASICAASAFASSPTGSGGVGVQGTGTGCSNHPFGSRILSRGDCGSDVQTLNWLLRAKASSSVELSPDYTSSTVSAVRDFERSHGQTANGIFEKLTRQTLTGSLSTNQATWYGGPLLGHQTACGQTLRRSTIGVANKTLPCGTRVVFGYQGRWVRAKVIDRGPYTKGVSWDLTRATADRLDFTSVGRGPVKVAVLPG